VLHQSVAPHEPRAGQTRARVGLERLDQPGEAPGLGERVGVQRQQEGCCRVRQRLVHGARVAHVAAVLQDPYREALGDLRVRVGLRAVVDDDHLDLEALDGRRHGLQARLEVLGRAVRDDPEAQVGDAGHDSSSATVRRRDRDDTAQPRTAGRGDEAGSTG
jgi:hypothetical protein